jgi:dihydrodipicolinate synthase/N-acetylneuraminate lyase
VRALDRRTLAGLWSAVPTPFAADGRLDAGALARNCERLAAVGADGVYTTDSDGEFYALELDEFRELAGIFRRAVEPTGLDAAMGVTWPNTPGIVDRIRAARDVGIPNVHVAFPFWMPLAPADLPRFFDELALAVPEARWIHYANPRSQPLLDGRDYARLAEAFPENLIGTKLGPTNIQELTAVLLHCPDLAHFVVDSVLVWGMMLGARGCYSYWVNTLPRWHRAYMDACRRADWAEALARHRKLMGWEIDHITPLRAAGYQSGPLGKARAGLTGFLDDAGVTRAPYGPVPEEMRARLACSFRDYWASELAGETPDH